MPPATPSTASTLTEYAQAVLDMAEAAVATTTAGVPASVFLAPAEPAFDCEFLAVLIPTLSEAPTSPLFPPEATARRGDLGSIILAFYKIFVVRCAPEWNGVNPPTDAAKSAVAGIVQQDGWVIWNAILSQEDTIFDGCIGVHHDQGRALPESGGFLGWTMTIHAMIPGIPL